MTFVTIVGVEDAALILIDRDADVVVFYLTLRKGETDDWFCSYWYFLQVIVFF